MQSDYSVPTFPFQFILFWVVYSNLTETIVWNSIEASQLRARAFASFKFYSLFLLCFLQAMVSVYQSLCQGAVLLTLVNDTKPGIAWVVQSPATSKI